MLKLKTNEFETAHYEYSTSKRRFSKEANIHYTFPKADLLISNTDNLLNIIKHHMEHQRPRLDVLDDYYEGENVTILKNRRRKEEHLADHRATHNFAEYVSQFIQGYMVGIPLKTVYTESDEVDELLKDINRVNDADAHNSDLVLDLSIYGRAYELIYRTKNDVTRFTLSSPLETFVIYDDTVEKLPIAAVRYYKRQFKNEDVVELYTESRKYVYVADDSMTYLRLENEEPHYLEGVPIVEYSNNRFRKGDFEGVLALIDLYDSAQSDLANYSTDINDAMLKIVGNVDMDLEGAQKMRDANILFLQTELDADGKPGTADADYIYKKYDVAGTEAYKTRIKNDIHMFTNTPNLDDEQFSGTQSGEAMKYKLFGLEQKRSIKERLFKRSLRERYRLISNITRLAREGDIDVNDILITFTPNLPKSVIDEIKSFTELGGELSEETKLSLLSFVENPQEELERIKAERPQGLGYAFGGGTDE